MTKPTSKKSRGGWTASSPARTRPAEGSAVSTQQPAALFEVLLDRDGDVSVLPSDLHAAYGSGLGFPDPPPRRPYVFSNFVTSIDGMATFGGRGAAEARLISGASSDDHWLMGVLRACTDAVLVGANTLRADPRHTWTARALRGADADRLDLWRKQVGAPLHPLQCFVTASGFVDSSAEVFGRPDMRAVVFTTSSGASRIDLPAPARVVVVSDQDGAVDLPAALRILREDFGVSRLLCEGGPVLFGQMLESGLVDEMFHTVAPVLVGAGPAGGGRLSLTQDAAWSPDTAPCFRLISARVGLRDPSHLFLRYRRSMRSR